MPVCPFRASLALLLAMASTPLGGEPIFQIDKGQGDTALRLIHPGDVVRLFCKSCSDVVYTTEAVETLELRPIGERFELWLNGEAADVTLVHVDSGYGDGWENLADLLGFVDRQGDRELPPAVDAAARLRPHAGSWTGTLGGDEVRLELTLAERRLTGSYERAGGGPTFELLATSYNATRHGETLILVERDAGGSATATLRGEIDAGAGTFTGTRSPLGGSPPEPFRLVHGGR